MSVKTASGLLLAAGRAVLAARAATTSVWTGYFSPDTPASRAGGNEQAGTRAAGSAGERRAGGGFWGDVDRIE